MVLVSPFEGTTYSSAAALRVTTTLRPNQFVVTISVPIHCANSRICIKNSQLSKTMTSIAEQAPVVKEEAVYNNKRKKTDEDSDASSSQGDAKASKSEETGIAGSSKESELDDNLPLKRAPISKARGIRLEQNRKAARESRRRKKVMIEELQRSVIFFSRANGTLKQQNDDLSRMLLQAQAQVTQIESQQPPQQQANSQPAPAPSPRAPVKIEGEQQQQQQQAAETVATQAMYESQGFPAVAARQAAHTMNPGAAPATSDPAAPAAAPGAPLPPMQPGATMQAMANFQQAAAAAMQAAVQGMQGIPGVSMASLAATPAGANPQQAYTDAMTALAMQQAAAAAAAGQQFFPGAPFMGHPMMAWQQASMQQQAQQAPAAPQPMMQQAAPAPVTQQSQSSA